MSYSLKIDIFHHTECLEGNDLDEYQDLVTLMLINNIKHEGKPYDDLY